MHRMDVRFRGVATWTVGGGGGCGSGSGFAVAFGPFPARGWREKETNAAEQKRG